MACNARPAWIDLVEKSYLFPFSDRLLITAALFANGGIICWGAGSFGVVGNDQSLDVGDLGTTSTLGFITFSDAIQAALMEQGLLHACAIFINARVRCWGSNDYQQLGDRTSSLKGNHPTSSVSLTTFVDFAPTINTVPVSSISLGAYSSIFVAFSSFIKRCYVRDHQCISLLCI